MNEKIDQLINALEIEYLESTGVMIQEGWGAIRDRTKIIEARNALCAEITRLTQQLAELAEAGGSYHASHVMFRDCFQEKYGTTPEAVWKNFMDLLRLARQEREVKS